MTQVEIYERCYAYERLKMLDPRDMHYHPGQEWRTVPKPGELEYLADRPHMEPFSRNNRYVTARGALGSIGGYRPNRAVKV